MFKCRSGSLGDVLCSQQEHPVLGFKRRWACDDHFEALVDFAAENSVAEKKRVFLGKMILPARSYSQPTMPSVCCAAIGGRSRLKA